MDAGTSKEVKNNKSKTSIIETEELNRQIKESNLTWTSLPKDIEEKVLDATGLLQQEAKAIRCKEYVCWTPYREAKLISKADYDFLIAYQKAKSKEQRDKVLVKFQDKAFRSIIDVIQNVCIAEDIKKFLVLVYDMLLEDMSRLKIFNSQEEEPWKAFLNLLFCKDEFLRNMAARIIAGLISKDAGGSPNESDLTFYLTWLEHELRHDNRYLSSVSRCLQILLKVDKYRVSFMHVEGYCRIIRLLSYGMKSIQCKYQLIFCLWIATFNAEVAERLIRYHVVSVLTDLLESAPNETIKVHRLITATFRNLLGKPKMDAWKQYACLLIQFKVPKTLKTIKQRKIAKGDPEHMEDILVVESVLEHYMEKLTSFETYRMEVHSKRLEWSIVHTNKNFWMKNAQRLNENDYELLRILISLLDISMDADVLCVAAHDLGEYMTFYSRGKKHVSELGGKAILLKLLAHQHNSVKFHALKALQILMLNNYKLLAEYVSDCQQNKMASFSKKKRQ